MEKVQVVARPDMTLQFDSFEDQPVVDAPAASAKRRFYRTHGKRAFDLLLTLALAPIVLPFTLLMAWLIALDGHNPFYSQERIGKGGRVFRIWKLRTMVFKADRLLETYLESNAEAQAEWDATQKLKRDPRITLVGRILRKTSMDELPQLWNVFVGDMSIIGPRPMMVNQKSAYLGKGYYRLLPGITGLWQVSDRNEGEFAGRVRYDDIYDRTVSLRTDLWVLMRTAIVVIRCTGY